MFNQKNPETVNLLLSRRSEKSRRMTGPGPAPEELEQILRCGMRVPDHGKLAPWRFVVVEGAAQDKLSAIMANAYVAEGGIEGDAKHTAHLDFPKQAPTMLAVISKPDTEHKVPVWEQHLSVGAACQNILVASHALGYAGQWLTGDGAYLAGVKAAFDLGEHDRIAGFLFIGSSNNQMSERPRPDYDQIVSFFD